MKVQLPIKNYPKQDEIFNSPAQIVVIRKGRRAGFTVGAANNTIKVALSGKKKKGLWVDTVNSNIERYVERFFLPKLRKLPEGTWHWGKQQKVLKILDFYMDFRSVDNPENIEGFGYDYMILNEAGIILKDSYLWQNAIKPMMWDSDCQVFIGGTPKGGGGEFEKLYRLGMNSDKTRYAAFFLSPYDNPYVPAAKIEEDKKDMPQRVVKQEIDGEFLEDSGIVFRGIGAITILDPLAIPEIHPEHLYIMGADLGKFEDFTVLTVYDRTDNKQVYQMRFKDLEWPFIRSKIKETSNKFNKCLVMLDSTGVGDPTYDDLCREGVPVEGIKFTNTLKKQMIEKLANWIELKNLYMLQLKETVDELTAFTYDISEKTDRVFYGAPPGMHDDVVISHALACWGMNPLIVTKKEPVMSTIQRDFLQKREDYGNNDEGEYGEYHDTTNY